MTAAAIAHQPPERSRCGHKVYGLSCQDYDRLVADAKGSCQICDVKPEQTKHGFLVVDHDAKVGDWAVRGLLCSRCNTQLDSHVHVLDSKRVARYLSRPWYRARLEELGLPPKLPEPPVGAAVKTRTDKTWLRTAEGWVRTNQHGRIMWTTTWATLERKHGPYLRTTGYTREHIRQIVLADKKKREAQDG